jgi:hypothetical protein
MGTQNRNSKINFQKKTMLIKTKKETKKLHRLDLLATSDFQPFSIYGNLRILPIMTIIIVITPDPELDTELVFHFFRHY